MNINNENYEEYFLLYADNELSAEQRKIVEMFVKANPQLQREWDEVMATIQTPDNISILDKSFLLKRPVDGFIDGFNYEKRFVEYHDGELSVEEKSFVQKFLTEHPELKEEFNLISQSYLAADKDIEFPDKKLLYHKTPVVRLGILIRIAAAAVFIGLIFWIGIQVMHKPNEPAKGNIATVEPAVNPTHITRPKEESTLQEKQSTTAPLNKVDKKDIVAEKNVVKKTEIEKEIEKSIAPEKNIQENNVTTPPPTEIAAMIPVAEKMPAAELNTAATITDPVSFTGHADIDATPVKQLPGASYATFRQDASQNDYVFTDIPAENIQRSKLGIFIKKVKRTIDRNNPINRLFNGEEN